MGTNGNSIVSSSRMKREEYKHTKHDPIFSEWKILIGPSDWENLSLNKEGAEKYRTQNLPDCSFCPGVYEFGIALSCPSPRSGQEDVIPVYVGQSDNVRSRLQQYGRGGAHLELVPSNGNRGHGLFTEIFSRGYFLVFRWAPMKTKRDAEKTEARMLCKFDYRWNKECNGARRADDMLQKPQAFHQRKVGLKLKGSDLLLLENVSISYANLESNHALSRILKFGRSQPRLVSIGPGVNKDGSNTICGVALRPGSVCIRSPVEGRKRCPEHKGMKVTKLITEGTNPGQKATPHYSHGPILEAVAHFDDNERIDSKRPGVKATPDYVHGPKLETRARLDDYELIDSKRPGHVNEDCSFIRGVNLENGRFCTKPPVVGLQRCEEHKGMRVKGQKGKLIVPNLPSVFDDSWYTCGATTLDGSSCGRKPVKGKKWCWQHEDTRTYRSSRSSTNNESTRSCSSTSSVSERVTNLPSVFVDAGSTCGAKTLEGSSCRRKTSKGHQWCWQHEGTRVDRSSRSSACNESTRSYLFTSSVGETFQSTCGAMTRNGSACTRSTAPGRRRCWQH